MGLRNWITKVLDKNEIFRISKECDIPLLSAALLLSRGVTNTDEIKRFTCCNVEYSYLKNWHGMKQCVGAVKSLISDHKKISVYGDYDADGVTATAVMYEYLKSVGADVDYYIPERDRDGYGLNNKAIDYLHSKGVEAIITVDNGISAWREIEYANSLGMKVIVTDHHKIPPKLPNAEAIIDPNIPFEGNVFDVNFAGVGVAFELIKAMESENSDFDFEKYLDLVALGTIGDSIELIGPTRNIVKKGISLIENSGRLGIRTLVEAVNLQKRKLDAVDIAFCMVPKINACGRMNSAETAMQILTCNDEDKAQLLCGQIMEFNNLRKEIEEKILFEATNFFHDNPESLLHKVIIAVGENWHHGVLGIVASRITEKYGKPCVLISKDGELAIGSCRSVPGFSIYNLVASCSGFLDRFGGHHMAAGFNLKSHNIDHFRDLMLQNAESMPIPNVNLTIDLCVNPSKITPEIFYALDVLKPFGNGNAEPIFGIMGAKLVSVREIGGGKHIKLCMEKDGFIFDALYFNKTKNDFLYYPGEDLDLAVRFSPNNYKGEISVTTVISDVRLSGYDFKNAINQKKIYEKLMLGKNLNGDDLKFVNISRDDIVKVYKYFKIAPVMNFRADIISERVFQNSESIAKIYIIIDILRELGLVKFRKNGDEYKISINTVTQKVSLGDSKIFKLITSKDRG
ncbi:MAG: single-stranded-DNA-specific exonuclease RecJ [Clostridia bacterium]|nr:single-stranded-DNA-specific exonuclease RecJ [Clostridia bacterium]